MFLYAIFQGIRCFIHRLSLARLVVHTASRALETRITEITKDSPRS